MKFLSLLAGCCCGLLCLALLGAIVVGAVAVIAFTRQATRSVPVVSFLAPALATAGVIGGVTALGRMGLGLFHFFPERAQALGLDSEAFDSALLWTFTLGFCGSILGVFLWFR